MVVAVLFNAGDQVPVIGVALLEEVGRAESTAPEQIGATAANVGTMLGLTVITSVAVVAH